MEEENEINQIWYQQGKREAAKVDKSYPVFGVGQSLHNSNEDQTNFEKEGWEMPALEEPQRERDYMALRIMEDASFGQNARGSRNEGTEGEREAARVVKSNPMFGVVQSPPRGKEDQTNIEEAGREMLALEEPQGDCTHETLRSMEDAYIDHKARGMNERTKGLLRGVPRDDRALRSKTRKQLSLTVAKPGLKRKGRSITEMRKETKEGRQDRKDDKTEKLKIKTPTIQTRLPASDFTSLQHNDRPPEKEGASDSEGSSDSEISQRPSVPIPLGDISSSLNQPDYDRETWKELRSPSKIGDTTTRKI